MYTLTSYLALTESQKQEAVRLNLASEDCPQVIVSYRERGSLDIKQVRYAAPMPQHIQKSLADANKYLWTWFDMRSNQAGKTLEQVTLEAKTAEAPVKRVNGTAHAAVGIKLYAEQTIMCEETGITESVRLACPASLNLASIHPLAHMQNVSEVIKHYRKSGLKIEQELEPQVLAGMLLTILRNKGLLRVKDAPKANVFLSNATLNTLGYAVRWFYSQPSVKNMPGVSLLLDDAIRQMGLLDASELTQLEKLQMQAEYFIRNYMKACTGESLVDEAPHLLNVPRSGARTVKVYTDTLVAQHKAADKAGKQGQDLLGKVIAANPGQHTLILQQVKEHLKGLSFLSLKLRQDVSKKLQDLFPKDANAIALAKLFDEVQQDAIEDDLFSFSQSLSKEAESFQAAKSQTKVKVIFDFTSKIKKVG